MRETEENIFEAGESSETNRLEEEAELFSELTSALNYAVRSGFCTEAQVHDWIAGYEDCGDHLDWKRNIVRILMERCMPTGEETKEAAEEILSSSYISPERKIQLEREFNEADSYGKEQVLAKAKREIQKKQKQEDEFNKLIFKIRLADVRKKYIQEFALSDSDEAKKVLDKLEKYSEQPVGHLTEMSEAGRQKIEQAIGMIESQLAAGEYALARQTLDAIGSMLNFSGKYQELSRKIDGLQTDSLQRMLKAA